VAEHPPLYFVRHGETDWNRARRIQGRTDVPLNAAGRAQAAAVATRLRQLVEGAEAVDFYSSPLGRARQTMAAILSKFDAPEDCAHYEERLIERSFGAFDGLTWREMFAAGIDPDRDPAAYHDWRPEGGESFADVAERVGAWLGNVRRPAIVVSHSGVSRALRGLLLGLDRAEIVHLPVPQHRFFRIADGEVTWFDLRPDRP
jgi:broad specificity phosphatase PhoE